MALRDGERPAAQRVALIDKNLEAGLAHHKAGRRDRAEALYRKVLSRAPNHPDALHLLGVVAHERGRHEYAVQLISRALAAFPDFPDARQNLGNALEALGRLDEAAASYRVALTLRPNFALAHANLATVLNQQKSFAAALEHATRAAELMPKLAKAHFHRGCALAAQRCFGEAVTAYRRSLELKPEVAETLSNLGTVLLELKQHDEALSCQRRAIELQPGNATFHYRLSAAQFYAGDPQASEATCRHAVALDPQDPRAWSSLGQVLRSLGRFDEARSCLGRALDLDPDMPDAYAGLAILGQRGAGEEQLDRLRALLGGSDNSTGSRIDAGFALGMLLDNADRCDEAFPAFAEANRLYHELLAGSGELYDAAALHRRVDGLIQSCTRDFFSLVEDEGNPSEAPVFVVGMPRSGTSLVEQIAATHSQVSGAGELPDLQSIANALQNHGHGRRADELDPDLGRRLANGYTARLVSLGGGAARVIDKMPDNILHLGLAAVLFPRARVVICRRDLRDTCLSCYFRRFDQPIPWAYDLAECGARAREIERLADHWRRVLPLPVLTIDYEALVADLEGESRRLIDFLGLDWEPACLDFHKTERPVLTASGWQVRQPLYTRAVGRWQKYAPHLVSLLEALSH